MGRAPLLAITTIISLFLFAGAGCLPSSRETDTGRLSVTATFYPLAFVAERVGGPFVRVTTLTPAGAEPHDFEPTAKDIAEIYDSDAFLYNGGGVDAWASKLGPDAATQGVRTLEMRSVVDTVLPPSEGSDGDAESFDEHFWLDPNLLKEETAAVRDLFADMDPTHAQAYRDQADALLADLTELDAEYRTGLASCQTPVAVTSHAAFAYMAHEYGFTQIAITGISPQSEPSAGDLAQLARDARDHNVTYVFFETLVSPKLANTLAEELNARTLVFNPLEGLLPEDIAAGADYFSVMRENLTNLRTAMLCH